MLVIRDIRENKAERVRACMQGDCTSANRDESILQVYSGHQATDVKCVLKNERCLRNVNRYC